MKTGLYTGSVMHRRYKGREHDFRYRVFWGLFDLDELSLLSRRLWFFSHNKANLFSLHDRDHGNGTGASLREQAAALLRENGISIGAGKIFLFIMPRTLGYSFNPLSLYFCHDEAGALAAVIYEVHNTFGGRHSYVMAVDGRADLIRHTCAKDFYVSPFLPMGLEYRFRVSPPDERVAVAIGVHEAGQRVFDAALAGKRRPFGDLALIRLFFAIPWVTAKVILAIHIEAVRLRLKGIVPHFPDEEHPRPRAP